MHRLDHIVLAVPQLDAACVAFAADTGCAPTPGGAHAGLGTRNALVAFDDQVYLEILGPDDNHPPTDFCRWLRSLEMPTLLHWAIRTDDLAATAAALTAAGLKPGPVRPLSRTTPQGHLLAWELMGVEAPDLGGVMPFFIDWKDCAHPATTSDRVGPITGFEVDWDESPAAPLIADCCELRTADVPGLTLRFHCPLGDRHYESRQPRGFPGL